MEPAGLVIGVVGLYKACIDIINRVDLYQKSDIESQGLSARLKATKVYFEQWARRVGISRLGQTEGYDQRLNDPDTATAVRQLLESIRRCLLILNRAEISLPTRFRQDEGRKQDDILVNPKLKSGNRGEGEVIRKRDRLKWAFGGKDSFQFQVEFFEILVRKLYDLIPQADGRSDTEDSLGLDSSKLSSLLKDAETRQLYAWIDLIPSDDRYEECLSRVEGSCEWIFAKQCYSNWLLPSNRPNVPRFLWLSAPPGFGKSTICARIVQSLGYDHNGRVAYHFCSADIDHLEDPIQIVKSWITQLAKNHEALFALVLEQMGGDTHRATRQKLWQLLRRFLLAVPDCILVVDGLDECTVSKHSRTSLEGSRAGVYEDRTGFIRSLRKAIIETDARVLLVSRDEVDLQTEIAADFRNSLDFEYWEHHIVPNDVSPDVLELAKSIVDSKLPKKSTEFRISIATQMARKSEGMFLWVELQGWHLRPGRSEAQLQRIVNEMPEGLQSAYSRNWSAIISSPGIDKLQAFKLLRWATYAIRPLKVAEMAEALSIPETGWQTELLVDELPDEIDEDYVEGEIVGVCQSLLQVRREDASLPYGSMSVHLKHVTVKEFLLARGYEFCLNDDSSHTSNGRTQSNNYLALACLRYLQSLTLQHWIEKGNTPSFLKYAAQAWPSHVSLEGSLYSETIQAVNAFFHPSNQRWGLWRHYYEQRNSVFQKDDGTQCSGPGRCYYAAFFGFLDTVKFLVDLDPNAIHELGGACGSPLEAAAAGCHLDVVQHLLEVGADINTNTGEFGSALSYASDRGAVDLSSFLLNYGADVNLKDSLGRTPLYLACAQGNNAMAEVLIHHGADVFSSTEYGWTPYHVASDRGHAHTIGMLLETHSYSLDENSDSYTPIQIAAMNGHSAVIQKFIDAGIHLSSETFAKGTPMSLACIHGRVEVIKLLLENGVDYLRADKYGHHTIHFAIVNGQVKVVKLLLDAVASLSAFENHGGAPLLHTAAYCGHSGIVHLLLEKGADVNMTDSDGRTAIHYAASMGFLKVVDILVNSGASPSQADCSGRTPLLTAAIEKSLYVVEFLLEITNDMSVPDSYGQTPLHGAVLNADIQMVKLLLDRGADVSVGNCEGQTPLHYAADRESEEMVEALLLTEADVKAVNNLLETPLHIACRKHSPKITQKLVSAGADRMLVDGYGRTAIDWASQHEPCLLALGCHPMLLDNPSKIDQRKLLQTIVRLIETSWTLKETLYYTIADCLLLAGDIPGAAVLFDKTFNASTKTHIAYCDRCLGGEEAGDIFGTSRYTCISCPDVDLCKECFEVFRQDEKAWRCQNHKFIEIPITEDGLRQHTEELDDDQMKLWLTNLYNECSQKLARADC